MSRIVMRDQVRTAFSALLDEPLRIGVLVPVDGRGALDAGYFVRPQRQLPLLWDSLRVNAYRGALRRAARRKVLVELGCDHGVLACSASRPAPRG